LNFGEIRKFLVKSEGNELPLRQEKTRKWRAQISANAIKDDWQKSLGKTLAARGLEEPVRITLIFLRIISFMQFTVLLSLMYFF